MTNDKLGLSSLEATGSSPGQALPEGASSPSLKPNESCDSSSNAAGVITADSEEKAIRERKFRLQELLDSERVYVCDLEHCCQYIQYMNESKDKEDHEIPMPDDLRDGKDRMIFGNIQAIYEWHREWVACGSSIKTIQIHTL